MQGLKKLSVFFLATVLSTVSLHGCALIQNRTPTHGPVDCRSCHTPDGASGAKDFSRIYANPSTHHPVGVKYPVGFNAKPGFNSPNGHSSEIEFFDRNGNGQPDSDEIQLFGESGVVTVECASCHKEHGNIPASANAIRNHYLRFDNTGSALCTTCHNY